MPSAVGVVNFPVSADDSVSLIDHANDIGAAFATATLTLPYTAGDPTLTVDELGRLPASGSVTVESEILYYTGRSAASGAGTLTGVTGAKEGTAPANHAAGLILESRVTARAFTVLRDAIIAAEAKIGTGSSTPTTGQFLYSSGAGVSAWTNTMTSTLILQAGAGDVLDMNRDGASALVQLTAYGTSAIPTWVSRAARGTLAAPLRTKSGDVIQRIGARSAFAADDVSAGSFPAGSKAIIDAVNLEDQTATAQGNYWVFKTTGVGSTGVTERLRITDSLWRDDYGLYDFGGGFLQFRQAVTNVVTGGTKTIAVQNQGRGTRSVNDRVTGVSVVFGDRSDVVAKAITAIANNGAGLYRITATGHTLATGDKVAIKGADVAAVNAYWTVTVIDANNFDLQGSTYTTNGTTGTVTNVPMGYCFGAAIVPTLDRGGLTGNAANGDDLNCYAAFNAAATPAKGTDAYYLGANAVFAKAVTGAANNGSGLIRITSAAHGFKNGDVIVLDSIAGTTEANGTWTLTGVATNTFDLVSSAFVHAYTSGGKAYYPEWDTSLTLAANALYGVRATGCYINGGAFDTYGAILYAPAFAYRMDNQHEFHGVKADRSGDYVMFKAGLSNELEVVAPLRVDYQLNFDDNAGQAWGNGMHIDIGTVTGVYIGNAPNQKIGFFGVAPIVQPANNTDIRQALINLGLYDDAGVSPLDLNGGTFKAGKIIVSDAYFNYQDYNAKIHAQWLSKNRSATISGGVGAQQNNVTRYGAGDQNSVDSGYYAIMADATGAGQTVTRTLIASATNANPGVFSTTGAAAHNLTVGDRIIMGGFTGTWAAGGPLGTGANGVWTVNTVPTSSSFSVKSGATPLDTSAFGAMTGAPEWTSAGPMTGFAASFVPTVAHGAVGGSSLREDDGSAFAAYNGAASVIKLTDAFYIGHNAAVFGTGNSEWTTAFTCDANADFGIRLTGRIASIGIDFTSGTMVGPAIQFADTQNLQFGTGTGTTFLGAKSGIFPNFYSSANAEVVTANTQLLVEDYYEIGSGGVLELAVTGVASILAEDPDIGYQSGFDASGGYIEITTTA